MSSRRRQPIQVSAGAPLDCTTFDVPILLQFVHSTVASKVHCGPTL